jgi:hypothetical protein
VACPPVVGRCAERTHRFFVVEAARVSLGILRRIVKTLKGARGCGVDAVGGLLLAAIRCCDKQNPSLVGCCYAGRRVWWLMA